MAGATPSLMHGTCSTGLCGEDVRSCLSQHFHDVGDTCATSQQERCVAIVVSRMNVSPVEDQHLDETLSLNVLVGARAGQVEACIPAWNVWSLNGAGVDDMNISDGSKSLCTLHCTP